MITSLVAWHKIPLAQRKNFTRLLRLFKGPEEVTELFGKSATLLDELAEHTGEPALNCKHENAYINLCPDCGSQGT